MPRARPAPGGDGSVGRGRKSLIPVTNGGCRDGSRMPGWNPGFFTAAARGVTSTSRCDGSHRRSFRSEGTYPPPTPGQFNMCNCTTPRKRRASPGRSTGGSPRTRCDPPMGPPRRPCAPPRPHPPDGRRTGPAESIKKIALDPAESSAIDDAPKSVGMEPVGAGVQSFVARWCLGESRVGGPGKRPVMPLFRPRYAAAECPPAARGPPLRGIAGVLRACGWT